MTEASPARNDFPFLPTWLRLLQRPFFRNSFSRVSLPTSRSSFSTRFFKGGFLGRLILELTPAVLLFYSGKADLGRYCKFVPELSAAFTTQ